MRETATTFNSRRRHNDAYHGDADAAFIVHGIQIPWKPLPINRVTSRRDQSPVHWARERLTNKGMHALHARPLALSHVYQSKLDPKLGNVDLFVLDMMKC